MQSGNLRTRIRIESEVVTRNAYGEELITWATLYELWAKQRAITGLKSVEGDSITSESRLELYIRYIPALSTKHRIVIPQRFGGVDYPSLVYRIESLVDVDGKNKEIKMVCKAFE